tara:strand:+ start:6887 stop:7444 length:558 start_codon:yes stop_codon:yes gene_type:complete
MKYTTHTYLSNNIPTDVSKDVQQLLDNVVELKKDQYWKNYENFDFKSEIAVSTQYNENGRLELFSTVHTRLFYPLDTYRLLTRFLRTPHGRLGGAKTNEGSQPSYEMLNQQIKLVKDLEPKFYFMSRQRINMRWIKFYLAGFNQEYNHNLITSKTQYWVTDSKDPAKGCQTLIYPFEHSIPFKEI